MFNFLNLYIRYSYDGCKSNFLEPKIHLLTPKNFEWHYNNTVV